MLAVLLLTGCNQIDDGSVVNNDPVSVSLSFAVSSVNQRPSTRQTNAVVQEGTSRTIQIQKIIPFTVQRKVFSGDMPSYGSIGGYDNTINPFFYYGNCSFLSGVSSFLVYGKAERDGDSDAVNGALNANFPGVQAPEDITFSLKQMRSTKAIHADAQAIANYLTTIAHTVGWSTTSDSRLHAYYLNFIGQGSERTSVVGGSANSVAIYVADLKARLQAEEQSTLRDNIIANIDNTKLNTCLTNNYPLSLGLPDGAAALRWEIPAGSSKEEFVPQTTTTTEAHISSLTRFAYPAELWYYGNSRICTSTLDDRKSYYSKSSWGTSNEDDNTVLSGFEYDPGMVSPNIKAVAIKEPLQYGVARLDVKFKAKAETLKDAKDNDIPIRDNNNNPVFPLTGIIIGGQRPVGFDFVPIDDDDTNMRFVYDSQVNTNTGDTPTPYYLSTTEQGPVRTLLLQSYDGEDVTIILEFQNDSGSSFYGTDGVVYNGTKFYLAGQLKLEDATGADNTRVFTQDQITTATLTINRLAKAYNVVPDLLSPQLEISVTITTPWTGSTPTTVIME